MTGGTAAGLGQRSLWVLVVAALVGCTANAAAARAAPPTPRIRIATTNRQALLSTGRLEVRVRVRRTARVRLRAVLKVGSRRVAIAPRRIVRVRRGVVRRVSLVLSSAARAALAGCAAPRRAVITISARARASRNRGRIVRSRATLACRGIVNPKLIAAPATHDVSGMTQLDRLPVLDPSISVAGASSHAPDGTNRDTGPYFEQDAQGRYVLMEAQGPGAITRIWMTGPQGNGPTGEPSAFGRMLFFVDGEDKPRIDLPAADFYAGKTPALAAPLCGDYAVSSGGNYCNLRIPYAKSIRVVSTGSPSYYNFGYETYPAGTQVASFDPTADATVQAVKAAGQLFARSGGDPDLLPAGERHTGTDMVLPAGRTRLAHISHAGTIRAIQIKLDRRDDATLHSVWLEARWDGQEQPAISAPLADLFISGAGERTPAKGLLVGYLPDKHLGYLYFPMPFAGEADIALVNRSASPVKATWSVQESPAAYASIGHTTGYFHATYNNDPATKTGVDYTLLDASGAGKIVGVSYTEEGPTGASFTTFMEGDERVYFDGSRTPAIYGTGTEDLFSGAYYYTSMFTLPDHGATAKEDVSPGTGRTSQYRLMLIDPWPFRDGIHFGIEHGAGDGEQTANHSVVYWYGSGRRALRQTGSFDVADTVSAGAAGYTGATGATAALTAFFEGDHDGNVSSAEDNALIGSLPPANGTDPMGESVTASGYNHPAGATIRFTAALDPANHGAILRRLLDQGTFGQRAEVLVDAAPAGVWLTPGTNPSKRWVESDFALPAALTAGKAQVAIELHVLPAVDAPSGATTGWTDYRYVTFSVTG